MLRGADLLSGFMKKTLMIFVCAVLMTALCGCSASRRESAAQSGDSQEAEDYSAQIFTMGTVFTVRGISDQSARDAVMAAESVLNNCDRQLSWRNEGSAADVFNNSHTADVSEIKDLIELSLQISKDSSGAFDMTILPLSQLWQFDRMEEEDFDPADMRIPDQKEIDQARSKIDYTKLEYDAEKGILSSEDPDLLIELGAIGKGYAIDQALASMKEAGASGALISAGSSIGLYGTKKDGNFSVALRDPRGDISDYIGILKLSDCTISTSGDYERYFERDGVRYHHILDPATGYPADSGLMQVTIISSSGLVGDALSTACFIMGLEDGMSLADKYNVLAIFVDTDKNIWYNNSDVLSFLEIISDDYSLHEYNQKDD